jgi:hypothetical protein
MEMQLDALEAEIESLERDKLFGGPSDDKHEDDEYEDEEYEYDPPPIYAPNADLRGANLSGSASMADLSRATLTGAKYTSKTEWPPDFDPEAAGAVLVEE